ncbi:MULTISPECIES: hypothetical protein [Sorangium]|uniref:Uncharacterized protein n=1 Tax=Sorangium cellulosum TaxID=56 RepID=A0A4P2QLU2_SORCE|nr:MULTISPECIES: hypothetical protein [Sorangium]AUX30796.1 hypothetical protein SOCE836_029090 [Sorangium cellulosum]WCQ90177.1 hypothetical protein NQZ70_02878 [Sorangium sp. Soce836]
MTTGFFEARGLRFRLDRQGAEVSGGPARPVQARIEPDEAGLDGDAPLAELLGRRLSALLGAPVSDEEGIFDLAVERDGAVVAAVQLSCGDDDEDDEDVLELLGERAPSLPVRALVEALVEALRGPG